MNLRPVWLLTALMVLAPLSGCLSFSDDSGGSGDGSMDWIDPVTEIEDENHSHNDLQGLDLVYNILLFRNIFL